MLQILDQYPLLHGDTRGAVLAGIASGDTLCRSRFVGSENEVVNLVSFYAGIEHNLTWYA